MNPQFSKADVDTQYVERDTAALVEVYSKISASPSVRLQWRERLDLLDRAMPTRGRLLDFGCGFGGFLEAAQRHGWDAHGVELGAWAGEAAAARGVPNLHVGYIEDMSFEPGSFDVVHSSQVFEHLPHPGNELATLGRLLRPGGILYLDVPNYRSLTIRVGKDDFMLNEPPQHLNYFSPQSMCRLLQAGGFKVVQMTSSGGLKWENLIGRSINSEIKDAYGLGQSEAPRPQVPAGPVRQRRPDLAWLKRLAMATVVRPILYRRLRLGMGLVVIAKRPVAS
jgi:SAM-dependent methyltransferase